MFSLLGLLVLFWWACTTVLADYNIYHVDAKNGEEQTITLLPDTDYLIDLPYDDNLADIRIEFFTALRLIPVYLCNKYDLDENFSENDTYDKCRKSRFTDHDQYIEDGIGGQTTADNPRYETYPADKRVARAAFRISPANVDPNYSFKFTFTVTVILEELEVFREGRENNDLHIVGTPRYFRHFVCQEYDDDGTLRNRSLSFAVTMPGNKNKYAKNMYVSRKRVITNNNRANCNENDGEACGEDEYKIEYGVNINPVGYYYITVFPDTTNKQYDLYIREAEADFEEIKEQNRFDSNKMCLVEGCSDFFKINFADLKFSDPNDKSVEIIVLPNIPLKVTDITYNVSVSIVAEDFLSNTLHFADNNGIINLTTANVEFVLEELKKANSKYLYIRVSPENGRRYRLHPKWDEVMTVSFGVFINTETLSDMGHLYNFSVVPIDAANKDTYFKGTKNFAIAYYQEISSFTTEYPTDATITPLSVARIDVIDGDNNTVDSYFRADDKYLPQTEDGSGSSVRQINLPRGKTGRASVALVAETSKLNPVSSSNIFATGFPLLANFYLKALNGYNPNDVYNVNIIADTVWPIYTDYFADMRFLSAHDQEIYSYITITNEHISEGGIHFKFSSTRASGDACHINVYYSIGAYANPLPDTVLYDGYYNGQDLLEFDVEMSDDDNKIKRGDKLYIGAYSSSCDYNLITHTVNDYIEDFEDNTIYTRELEFDGTFDQEFDYALNIECNIETGYDNFTLDRGFFGFEVMNDFSEFPDLAIKVEFYKRFIPKRHSDLRSTQILPGSFAIEFTPPSKSRLNIGLFELGSPSINSSREYISEIFVVIKPFFMGGPPAAQAFKGKKMLVNMLTAAYDTWYENINYSLRIPNRVNEIEYFKLQAPRGADWTFTLNSRTTGADMTVYFCPNSPTFYRPLDNSSCISVEVPRESKGFTKSFRMDDYDGEGARLHGNIFVMVTLDRVYDDFSNKNTWSVVFQSAKRHYLGDNIKLKLSGGTDKTREYHYGSILLNGINKDAVTNFAASIVGAKYTTVCFSFKYIHPDFGPADTQDCEMVLISNQDLPETANVRYNKFSFDPTTIPDEGRLLYFGAYSLIEPGKDDVTKLFTGIQYNGEPTKKNVVYMGYKALTSFDQSYFGYDKNGNPFTTKAHFDFAVSPGGSDISITVAPYMFAPDSIVDEDYTELELFMYARFNLYITTVPSDFLVASHNAKFISIAEPGMTVLTLKRDELFDEVDPDKYGKYHIYVTVETTQDIVVPILVDTRVHTSDSATIYELPYMSTSYTNEVEIPDANSYTKSTRRFHYDIEAMPTEITVSPCKGMPRARFGITDYYERTSFNGYANDNRVQENKEHVVRKDCSDANGNVDYNCAGRDFTFYKYGAAVDAWYDDWILELNDFDIHQRAKKEGFDINKLPEQFRKMGYAAEVYASTTDARPSVGVRTVRTELYGSVNDSKGTNDVYFSIQFVPSITSGRDNLSTEIEYAVFALPAYFADADRTKPSSIWWSPYTACGAYYGSNYGGGATLWENSYSGSEWMSFERFEEFHEFNTTVTIPQELVKGSFWLILVSRIRPDRFSKNNTRFLWDAYSPVLFKDGEIYQRVPHVDESTVNYVILASVLGSIVALGAIAGIVAGVVVSRKKKIAQARMNNYENLMEN